MMDEIGIDDGESGAGASAPDSAAAAIALAAASREKADAFLIAQTAIAHLQREHLHEQRELQISHLKWRRFNLVNAKSPKYGRSKIERPAIPHGQTLQDNPSSRSGDQYRKDRTIICEIPLYDSYYQVRSHLLKRITFQAAECSGNTKRLRGSRSWIR